MTTGEFVKLKERYDDSDVEGKIDIYMGTEGLSQEQYMALLRCFPINELPKLEAAMG